MKTKKTDLRFARSITLASLCMFSMLPKGFAQSISDSKIMTADDLNYCGGGAPLAITKRSIDPTQLPDDGSVWRVGTNRWNQVYQGPGADSSQPKTYEDLYSDFVAQVGLNVFVDLQLSTDCVDASIALRMIFARIYHLPEIMVWSPTKTYSFTSKGYRKYPTVPNWDPSNWKASYAKDIRFQKFITEVVGAMGTPNIGTNTYPQKIFADSSNSSLASSVKPGALLFSGDHMRLLYKVDTSAAYSPLSEISSTTPAQVRPLRENTEITLYEKPRESKGTGVLGFLWAYNCGGKFRDVRKDQMANYSLEQYSDAVKDDGDFGQTLESLVPGTRGEVNNEYMLKKARDLRMKIVRHFDASKDAVVYFGDKIGTSYVPTPAEDEDQSTPGLDKSILQSLNRAIQTINTAPESQRADLLKAFYGNLQDTKIVPGLSGYLGYQITHAEFLSALIAETNAAKIANGVDPSAAGQNTIPDPATGLPVPLLALVPNPAPLQSLDGQTPAAQTTSVVAKMSDPIQPYNERTGWQYLQDVVVPKVEAEINQAREILRSAGQDRSRIDEYNTAVGKLVEQKALKRHLMGEGHRFPTPEN